MLIAFVHFLHSDAHLKVFVETNNPVIDKNERYFWVFKDKQMSKDLLLNLDNVSYIEFQEPNSYE